MTVSSIVTLLKASNLRPSPNAVFMVTELPFCSFDNPLPGLMLLMISV